MLVKTNKRVKEVSVIIEDDINWDEVIQNNGYVLIHTDIVYFGGLND